MTPDIEAICRGEWPAGTRVRCVDDTGTRYPLVEGAEYSIVRIQQDQFDCWAHLWEIPSTLGFFPKRFKPVIRVPMGRKDLAEASA